LFSEIRDCNRGNAFPEYGTPHPNAQRWPDHKLVFIKPVDIERNEIFEFFYAADRENQDLYNFSFGLQSVGTNRQFRAVQREYVTLRENFQPLDIPFGNPMPDTPEGKFDGVEYVFFQKQQKRIDQQELDSLYVAEAHTYIEKAFLDDKLSYATQRTDPLPSKFQILVPEQVFEQIVEGAAEMPVLTGSDLSVKEDQLNLDLKLVLSAREDQLNPDVKLVRTVTRDRSPLPVSLDQKATTNEKQLATVTETVQSGDTIEEPSATVDIESQALGDGTYVVRKTEVPELFTAKSYSAENPDLVPPKFRAALPTTTEEASEVGVAAPITLESGDLAATEQQQNKFVKRKRKTKRDLTSLPQALYQKTTTNEKQLATVVETLQVGDTSESPSALVDIQSEAMGDGTYVVRKVSVPALFTAKSYSVERPDVTPPKFKALIPETTTQQNSIGSAVQPRLTDGVLAITEQQVDQFVKRVVTSQRTATLPKILTQKATTDEKLVVKITETLQTSEAVEPATAKVDIQSEALGDGTYIVRKTEAPEVFKATVYSEERPDNVPLKFRSNLPVRTTEESTEGTVVKPVLKIGQLSVEEKQQNKYVKRVRTSERNIANAQVLTQKETTNQKQVATVFESFKAGDTDVQPSATVDIQSEALGDGTYIVRETRLPSLFKAESYSAQKPDIIPDRFKTELETVTEEKFVEGNAEPVSLNNGELQRTEQQINAFVYREQVVRRDLADSVELDPVERTYVEGTKVTVKEKLSADSAAKTGLHIVQSEVTNVGDGKFIVQTVEVSQWPKLTSSEWDYELNTQIQKTEEFVAPPTDFSDENVQFKIVNEDRSLKIKETAPEAELEQYHMSFPVRIDVQLPNVLKKVDVKWINEKAEGDYKTDWQGSSSGDRVSLSGGETNSVDSSCTVRPELVIDIEQPWGADLPATAHVFFIKGRAGRIFSESDIRGKVSELAGGSVQAWPVFKPVSHTVLLHGVKATITAKTTANASLTRDKDSQSNDLTTGEGESFDYNHSFTAVTIPPTIHQAINFSNSEDQTESVTATCQSGWVGYGGFPSANVLSSVTRDVKGKVEPKSLEKTSPEVIPSNGFYIIKSTVEPYKWGYAKCMVIVLDASEIGHE